MPISSQSKSVRELALDTAISYIGTLETKYNSSPVVDRFIRNGGGVPGNSWCMFFVYYCYSHAYAFLGKICPLLKTGRCSRQLKHAASYGSKLKVIKVAGVYGTIYSKLGDIPIFKNSKAYASDIGKDFDSHTAIIRKDSQTNVVETVEGNTNSKSTYNSSKDGVFGKSRNLKSIKFPVVALIRIRQ